VPTGTVFTAIFKLLCTLIEEELADKKEPQ